MRKQTAFTLIELLVVIAIMAILLGVVQPMLSGSASKTREFECESNLKHIAIAMNAYVEDYGAFPARLRDLDSILQDGSLLLCPKTSREYYYRPPAPDAGRHTVIASCIDPRRNKDHWPHRFGSCYLTLSASGGVGRVCR